MSDIGDILKPIIGGAWHSEHPAREAVAQLYSLGLEKILGDKPLIKRYDNHTLITWKEGQARAMQKYIARIIWSVGKPVDKAPSREFSLSEVQVDMKPVLVPLVLKTVLPFLGIYTFLVFYMGRQSRRK